MLGSVISHWSRGVIIVAAALWASVSWSHGGEEGPVALEPDITTVSAGAISFSFQLVETEKNRLLSDRELDLVHEKKLHFLIYDPALVEFRHVHPEFVAGKWFVDFSLAANGNYWLWAQGTLGGNEFSAPTRLAVTGGAVASPAPPSLGDLRANSDGLSKVTLDKVKLRAGKMAMIKMTFSRTDGSTPLLTDYLGASAHVVAVPSDGDSLIHVHPMAGSKPNEGILHTTFPLAGDYRLWVQFVDGGVLRIVPLSVKVAK